MTLEDLNDLEALHHAASNGPWHVRILDDELCCGALTVSTVKGPGRKEHRRGWDGEEMVAACLLQNPPYVIPEDDRFEENARLIAATRNALPELIRLARLALHG